MKTFWVYSYGFTEGLEPQDFLIVFPLTEKDLRDSLSLTEDVRLLRKARPSLWKLVYQESVECRVYDNSVWREEFAKRPAIDAIDGTALSLTDILEACSYLVVQSPNRFGAFGVTSEFVEEHRLKNAIVETHVSDDRISLVGVIAHCGTRWSAQNIQDAQMKDLLEVSDARA